MCVCVYVYMYVCVYECVCVCKYAGVLVRAVFSLSVSLRDHRSVVRLCQVDLSDPVRGPAGPRVVLGGLVDTTRLPSDRPGHAHRRGRPTDGGFPPPTFFVLNFFRDGCFDALHAHTSAVRRTCVSNLSLIIHSVHIRLRAACNDGILARYSHLPRPGGGRILRCQVDRWHPARPTARTSRAGPRRYLCHMLLAHVGDRLHGTDEGTW